MYRSTTWWRAALVAALTIVTFDAVASTISRAAGVPYTNFIEATIGWAVSWRIGPGRVEGLLTTEMLVGIVIYVAIVATILGAVGALAGGIGRSSRRRDTASD